MVICNKDRDLGESNELKRLKGKNRVRMFTNSDETSSETNEKENSNALLRGLSATGILRTRSKVKGY